MLFLFKMLTAIHFNNEFPAWRAKVFDVVANGVLLAEMSIYFSISLFAASKELW